LGRKSSRIITGGGIALITVLVAVMAFLALESSNADSFARTYGALVTDSRSLTEQYQNEVGKWTDDEYDNSTMASITDDYLPRFQQLIDRANALQPTEKYKTTQEYLVKSLDYERQSYEHFRNYLITGDPAEDEMSTELLSESLDYEDRSFAAFTEANTA
jgi:hypothetical protein